MSLFKIFDISGSAMSAQTTRLNTTASNLANADTVASSPDEAYKARHPVFRTQLQDALNAGVDTVGIVESQAPVNMRYEPGHPMADEKGYVYGSNVDTVEETVNMLSASRSYQTNVQVLNTSKELMLRTLNLGKS
ncbi:MAG: flagellar basal body rod protein FlgC [Pseudomonadota bacterium]